MRQIPGCSNQLNETEQHQNETRVAVEIGSSDSSVGLLLLDESDQPVGLVGFGDHDLVGFGRRICIRCFSNTFIYICISPYTTSITMGMKIKVATCEDLFYPTLFSSCDLFAYCS